MSNIISDEQRKLNAALHQTDSKFGNRSDGAGLATKLPMALARMNELGICQSVLDYGTGKGALVERLTAELKPKIDVYGYDPAIPTYSEKPTSPVDIVVCLDVLEHIEMNSIDDVLREIKSLTKQFCYLAIDLQPAVKTLEDGRNAHILLAPADWWVSRISQLFPCISTFPVLHESGIPQKIVIAACHHPKTTPFMYGFLLKLGLSNFIMGGGILHKKMKYQKAQKGKN